MFADISDLVDVFGAPGSTTLVLICPKARRFTSYLIAYDDEAS